MDLSVLILIIIGVVMMVAFLLVLAGVANVFQAGDNINTRLTNYVSLPDDASMRRSGSHRRAGFMRFRMRLNLMMSSFASEEINLQLLTANWPISASEYTLLRYGLVALCLVLGWLISGNPLPGIGLAILAYIIPPLILRQGINRRRLTFQHQLVDILLLVQGAVRAGYSFQQALDVVVREMKAPASEEFRRVRHEIGLGLTLSQALGNMVTRMDNDDFYLVVTAININQQVGGNLVTMLDAVTNTIRDRVRLFSEVRVLTSSQRFSGLLLSLMPIAMAGILFVLNPDYMSRLFQPNIYLCIPIGAGICVILGNIIIRKLAKIDV